MYGAYKRFWPTYIFAKAAQNNQSSSWGDYPSSPSKVFCPLHLIADSVSHGFWLQTLENPLRVSSCTKSMGAAGEQRVELSMRYYQVWTLSQCDLNHISMRFEPYFNAIWTLSRLYANEPQIALASGGRIFCQGCWMHSLPCWHGELLERNWLIHALTHVPGEKLVVACLKDLRAQWITPCTNPSFWWR